jgi:hypothetical protein
METQEEKRLQPSPVLKDKASLSDDQLNRLNSDRLDVRRNFQLNSVSPTLHKVQVPRNYKTLFFF